MEWQGLVVGAPKDQKLREWQRVGDLGQEATPFAYEQTQASLSRREQAGQGGWTDSRRP